MPVTVAHTTPSDGSFSATGAAAWDANHSVVGLGTLAEQNSNNVSITGGSITGVSGLGTVTSVGGTGTVNGITLTGTVTSSGSLTLGGTLSGVDLATQTTGTLSVSRGGTGATTLTGVVKGNGTSAFTAGTVSLTTEVSGTLPVANGGTGVTTSTGTTSVVLSNSPTLVTPTLGAASATSIANGLGAVGTPSYTFTGNLNTGMWSPAADTIAFSEGGNETMRIDSSGNVGIGTTSPSSRLDVNSLVTLSGVESSQLRWSISGKDWRANAAAGGNWYIFDATNTKFPFTIEGNTPSDTFRIASSGNVGIGTGAPNAVARLDVTSTTSGFLPPRMTTVQRALILTPPNGLMLYNTTTDKLQVYAAGVWVDLH